MIYYVRVAAEVMKKEKEVINECNVSNNKECLRFELVSRTLEIAIFSFILQPALGSSASL